MNAYIKMILIIAVVVVYPQILTADYHQSDLLPKSGNDYNLTLASTNQGSVQDSDSSKMVMKPQKRYYYKADQRSEATAFFLGMFPGFFVHGLGHLYAGDGTTGGILLLSELITLPLSLAYLLSEGFNDDENGKFNLQDAWGIACIGILFGGWMYDFIHAPIVVEKYNKNARANIRFYGNQSGGVNIALNISF